MSWRQIRKKFGSSLPPPDSDDSDGVYDPLKNRQNNTFSYEGLEVSSHSEPEGESDAREENEESSVKHSGARKKKPHKKSKRKKMKATPGLANDLAMAGPSGSGKRCRTGSKPVLDEIDRSLMEVNALLGEPEPAPPEPEIDREFEELKSILGIQVKYLNVCNELKRLFGPEEPEDVRKRTKEQPYRARLLKRVLVSPTSETMIYNFKRGGLTMSIDKCENGVTYFVYDHDPHYQRMHSSFLDKYARGYLRPGPSLSSLEILKRDMHVEPLLDIADFLFRMDENSMANEIVENVVTYLQYCAHPSFNLSGLKVRLLYDYLENRPFHVAMLKYLYLLSNKACHRTALEIAKMLLNVDPSDPLAIVLVIDTLALRAREHQWLIEVIDYLKKRRQAGLLFNIQYSYSLALFHVAIKNKRNLAEADRHLQAAIIAFPAVVVKIFEFASIKEPRVLEHNLFTEEPKTKATEGLTELMLIYARLTWERWREPRVIEWLTKIAIEATENYDNSEAIRKHTKHLAKLRHDLFQAWPVEILRHVLIIKSMASLLMDTTLHVVNRRNSGWDPLCDCGINRYNYSAPIYRSTPTHSGGRALLYRFFTSIIPSNEFEPPAED